MNELLKRSIAEHSAALGRGEYSSQELTHAYLDAIMERDGEIGAYLTVDAENAMRAAREADGRRADGAVRGMLDGIPYALKDNFCTRGLRTTCASRMLENFVPPYDATVVTRLRDAGAILLGKTNMDEFAMGSSTETSKLGVTRNPVNTRYVPGGSSGGSAAAVAAHEAVFSIGSDTGGSVRQPAAFCGVIGMKPTYGVISRYGMVALASSLDCVGLFTHTAADCGAVLSALVGKDCMDATSVAHPSADFSAVGARDGRPLRVAVVRELLDGGEVSDAMRHATEQAIEALKRYGAEICSVSLPSPEAALATYCVLSAAEASSNLARYDGITYGRRTASETDLFSTYANSRAEGFGSEVKRRILFGTYMLSEGKRELYYERACRARQEICLRMQEILEDVDIILNPTTPTAAGLFGAQQSPAKRRRADLCAVYASLAGLPAVSVPFGRNPEGMPIGVQLTAAPFAEGLLLRVARLLEEVRP